MMKPRNKPWWFYVLHLGLQEKTGLVSVRAYTLYMYTTKGHCNPLSLCCAYLAQLNARKWELLLMLLPEIDNTISYACHSYLRRQRRLDRYLKATTYLQLRRINAANSCRRERNAPRTPRNNDCMYQLYVARGQQTNAFTRQTG